MNRTFVSGYRFVLVTSIISAAFLVLLGRLFFLHVWEQDALIQIVEERRQKFQVIPFRRGNIVDSQGNLLATTKAFREVGVDPESVPFDLEHSKIVQLSRLLNVPVFELEKKFTRTIRGNGKPVRWRKLVDAIDESIYEKVMALKIKGIYGNQKYERIYPSEHLASHLVGFVNKEGKAVTGVERYLDFYLRGQNGWRESERDGRRRELAQFRSREVNPHDGFHVELSLDLVIQHMLEEELKRIAEEYSPKAASIIVSEPFSGYILGVGNYPTFDPNAFWEYDVETHRNRAITDTFEPGSTFKIVPSAGALNDGLVHASDQFDCGLSSVEYNGRKVRLPSDHHPLGVLSVENIVVKSSNRGAALLGIRLGAERLYDYASAFGFGDFTGYGPGGEVRGTLHPVKKWDGLTISRLPMGHAVSATPMQVNQAMAVIANGGVLMEPQVLTRIFDEQNENVIRFKPKAKRRVIDWHTAKTVAEMLEKVVGPEGTARRANIPGYRIAGKTGTTQKIIDGRYSNKHHVGSFVGFFPANAPRLVITVVVDEPQLEGLGYGGVVAAPAFRNIAEQCIRYLGIQAEKEENPILAHDTKI